MLINKNKILKIPIDCAFPVGDLPVHLAFDYAERLSG